MSVSEDNVLSSSYHKFKSTWTKKKKLFIYTYILSSFEKFNCKPNQDKVIVYTCTKSVWLSKCLWPVYQSIEKKVMTNDFPLLHVSGNWTICLFVPPDVIFVNNISPFLLLDVNKMSLFNIWLQNRTAK